MSEGLDLVFHSELTSTKQHPLLLNPPYQLTLSILELTTPKDLNRNKNNVADDNIPRPHNAFILFRSDYAAKMKNNSNDQRISIRVISQMASKQWKKESEKVKLFFKVLADLYQEHHRELYPNYKYTPKTKSSPPYNIKKNKSKANSKRDEQKRKKNECMITWYVHDNIEDEDKNTKDTCNSTNFVGSNDPFEQDSQMSFTRTDSQQTPATFINYTASSSSSSLTFHSTTTTSTSTSSYDRFAVNSNYSSSGSSPSLSSSSPSPPPSPQPENLLYWEPELPNNNNLLSLLDFDNGDFFFN